MEFFAKSLNTMINLWERGKALLWALAGICAVIFVIFLAVALQAVPNVDAKLLAYVLFLGGAVVFGVLALIRTVSDRKRPTVRFIADERQSYWHEWKYPDGRMTTNFVFRLEATNLTNMPIRLSAARLTRPRTGARVIESDVLTRSPDYPRDNRYSHENSILSFDTTKVLSIIKFDDGIGGPGAATLETTLRLSDQFGRWHKVKCTLPRAAG